MAGANRQNQDLVWVRPPQPALSRQRIAQTAIAIADTEGVDAVTMRHIAVELGCGTMSLYRYVRTKDEVLDLMIDTAIGEGRGWFAEPSGDWRTDLTALAWSRRATVLRHPWLAPQLAGRRPFLGPNLLMTTEFALTAVDGLGLSQDEMVNAVGIVDAFVQGFTQIELGEQQWRHPADDTPSEDAEGWQAGIRSYIDQLVKSGEYPRFVRAVVEAEDIPDPNAKFQWELDRVLDGLATAIRARDTGAP